MNRYEKISHMEVILDNHQQLLDQFLPLLEAFSEHQKEYRRLAKYYGSNQFIKDYDAANSPSFPRDLKCGVLSEDTVYNLLVENRQAALRMLEIASDILKHE